MIRVKNISCKCMKIRSKFAFNILSLVVSMGGFSVYKKIILLLQLLYRTCTWIYSQRIPKKNFNM